MSEQPDAAQQKVILAPLQENLLVLAGPGSGKTRTLIGRIAFLLSTQQEPSESVMAVTFTNKAARELQTRLEPMARHYHFDMPQCVGTFHALAYQILREYPNAVEVPPRFTVCDEAAQETLLRQSWDVCGYGAHPTRREIQNLSASFSLCKRLHHDPTECDGDHLPPTFNEKQRKRLAVAYRRLLRDYHRLDFDDLILYAAKLLYEDESIAEQWRSVHKWLFVDEFQDIDPAQYQFLQLLTPPTTGRVMAVMDTEQRIYSWRGAEERLRQQFEHDYRPKRYELTQNYRAGALLTRVCDHLLEGGGVLRQSRPQRQGTSHCVRHWSQAENEEADWMAAEITQLAAQGVPLHGMGVVYRHHRVGESLEMALRNRGFEAWRIQRQPFMERREVQELCRYLEAADKLESDAFSAALNFPRVVADEFTMVELRQLAQAEHQPFGAFLQTLPTRKGVSPATRVRVQSFFEAVSGMVVPVVQAPMAVINTRLFALIEQRRSPYPRADVESLRGMLGFLEKHLSVAAIVGALVDRQPLHIVAENTLDGWSAAAVLAGTLNHFCRQTLTVAPGTTPTPPNAVRVVCGGATEEGIAITSVDAGTMVYPASLIAWQTAAAVVLAFERAAHIEVALLDLETTGTSTERDRPVEMAALRVKGFRAEDEGFASLAHPGQFIPTAASNVHGIFDKDVQAAPPLAEVIPRFAAYLGDRVLVGHNVLAFDVPLLGVELGRHDLPPLHNPVVDTLTLAKRLLPDAPNYTLETLVEVCGLPTGDSHRAMNDVLHTYHLLRHLWQLHLQDQQLHLLTGALPLVAVALEETGAARDEGLTLMQAGARVWHRGAEATLQTAILATVPVRLRERLAARLERLGEIAVPATPEDGVWVELQEQWEQFTQDVARLAGDTSLQTFLNYAYLMQGESENVVEGRLPLMTIHAAKGKEFQAVFLVGMEDKELPSWRAKSIEAQAEERRVCYVAMSRAKEYLYLLGCEHRGGRQQRPSPYWHELEAVLSEEPP